MGIYNNKEGMFKRAKIWSKFDILPYLTMPHNTLLTCSQAIRYLGVSETTFYRTVYNKHIFCDSCGLYAREDLDEYLSVHNPDRYRLIISVIAGTRERLEMLKYKEWLDAARAIAEMYGEEFLLELIRNGCDGTEIHDVRAIKLSDPYLRLSPLAVRCLRGMHLTYVYELENFTEDSLRMSRNMGKRTFREIREFMLKHGLKFRAEVSDKHGGL